MKEPDASVAMKDFPGMILQADPRDLPPGAAEEQVNAQSQTLGVLSVRPGFKVVRFEED